MYPILLPKFDLLASELIHFILIFSLYQSFDYFKQTSSSRVISRYSPIPNFDPIASQKRMERHAIDTGNYVALYAETQLTREDFDEMFEFNLRNYVALRKRMRCEKAFPHVYEKISKLGRT